MKAIVRYVFWRVLMMTAITLIVTTALVLITQILPLVDMVTRSRDALGSFFKVGFLLTPTMAVLVAPFALLLAALRTLSQMNSDSELVVLEAAGRSPFSTVWPIIGLSILMSLATLLTVNTIEPWATRQFRDILVGAQADLIGQAVQSGSFSKIQENTWIQISEELPGGEFGKILIIDSREPNTELIYYAKRGKLVNHERSVLLLLLEGELHRRDRIGGEVSIISYASTVLDLAQFTAQGVNAGDRPEELSTGELVAAADSENVPAKRLQELKRELHRRNTDWFYPLVFGLVAVFFAGSARTQRQEQPAQIALGALAAILLRVLGFVAISRAGVDPLFAAAAYMVPISAIVVLYLLVFTGYSLRFPKLVIELLIRIGVGFAAIGRLLGLPVRAAAQQQGRNP